MSYVPNPTIYLTDEEKRYLEAKRDGNLSGAIRELVQADMDGQEVTADA